MKALNVAACACALLLSSEAWAGSVTIGTDASDVNYTTALAGFATVGGNYVAPFPNSDPEIAINDMNGMTITAFFGGGSQETISWTTTSAGSGGAFGTGWSMVLSNDTYWPSNYNFFELENNSGSSITRFVMDGGPGDTVFDRYTGGGNARTAGSADGGDFILVDSTTLYGFNPDGTYNAAFNGAYDVTATYRNPVALTGDAPLFDLWRVLDVQITSAGGIRSDESFIFGQDTDNLSISGDLTTDPVPEPGTILLFGVALAGAAVLRRRRKA